MKRGLGVDLLEELLARHRRREHAEGPLRRGFVALGGRRRAAISERDRVETFFVGRAHRRLDAAVREEATEHDRLDLLLHERGLEVRRLASREKRARGEKKRVADSRARCALSQCVGGR